MTYKNAKKLHHGDEVIDKLTEDSILVIQTTDYKDRKVVIIEGIGIKQGHQDWNHYQVK